MTRKPLQFSINPLLSGPSFSDREKLGSPYREIRLSDIDVDPDQPRRVFSPESLSELADSIRQFGVISPILVKPLEGGTYRVVAGERRFRASKLAGEETIPALIDSSDDGRTLAKQLVENLQREELSSMERALAIGQLKERQGLSIREIAEMLGVSKSMVQRSLDVLHLPDDLQAALIAGASESKVFLLAQIEDRAKRRDLISRLEDITRSELERIVSGKDVEKGAEEESTKVSHRGTVAAKGMPLSEADMRFVESLQKTLGTKTKIIRSPKDSSKGRICIDFFSDEMLSDIAEKLLRGV